MAVEKALLTKLNRFATAFKDARDRGANESDTVMFLVKFFEEVLGYDSLKGEISKELAIKDRYCDIAIKIDGTVQFLVECKSAGLKGLVDKHIEQAENYASRQGICWVLLTNGIEWKLYHLTFAEWEGIAHDLAFEVNFLDELAADSECLWEKLELLSRDCVESGDLESFWAQKKLLSPASVIKVLFTQDVLMVIRRELNRNSDARLDIEDVFASIRDVLSKESLMSAGDIGITKRRKKRKKITPSGEVIEETAISPDAGIPQSPCGDARPTESKPLTGPQSI
jgi:hypothetical protein